GEGLGATRVAEHHLVAGRERDPGDRAADVTRADGADGPDLVHVRWNREEPNRIPRHPEDGQLRRPCEPPHTGRSDKGATPMSETSRRKFLATTGAGVAAGAVVGLGGGAAQAATA